MRTEEVFPWLVAAELHALHFGNLEGVHANGADERDVDAETAVGTGAGEAEKDAEFRGCLGGEQDELAGAQKVLAWRV